jgi:hypothetical protein
MSKVQRNWGFYRRCAEIICMKQDGRISIIIILTKKKLKDIKVHFKIKKKM